MDEREIELLRQRVAFLEQTVERCLEHIAALEARVGAVEARPVALAPTEEMVNHLARRVAEVNVRRPGSVIAGKVIPGGQKAWFEAPIEGTPAWEKPRKRK